MWIHSIGGALEFPLLGTENLAKRFPARAPLRLAMAMAGKTSRQYRVNMPGAKHAGCETSGGFESVALRIIAFDGQSGHWGRRLIVDQARSRSEDKKGENKEAEGILQRFLSKSETEISRLGAPDGGRKGVAGESAQGSQGGRAEKGHRPGQGPGLGERGRKKAIPERRRQKQATGARLGKSSAPGVRIWSLTLDPIRQLADDDFPSVSRDLAVAVLEEAQAALLPDAHPA